jgi:hypothetical protein
MTMRGLVPLLLGWLMLATLPAAESRAAAAAPSLFDSPAGVRETSPGIAPPATVRQRPVATRLDVLTHPDGSPALVAGQRVQLNLFDDTRLVMIVTDVTRHPGGGLTWSGPLDGIDLGSAVLATYDGAFVGSVSMPGATYRIGYAPDGTPVVEEVDAGALPREGPAIVPPSQGATARDAETPDAALDTGSQIDVAVLYTAAARTAANGTAAMRAEARLAVAAANQAYANNGLDQRLRLVYTGERPVAETSDFTQDLTTLKSDPTVAWLRNATRADVVSLIVDHGPSAPLCGIGWLMTTNSVAFSPFAFSVVERTCASGNLSFPHELGHNMGAHHDVFVAGTDPTLSPYSHGFVDLVGRFRTIMAYNDQCAVQIPTFNCQRIQFFSTPNKTFGGRTMGNAATADNARTLGDTANTVANFRQSLTSPLTLAVAVNQPTFSVGQTLVASVSVDHPGGVTGAADFYVGVLLPDGTALFFTDLTITPTRGYALGTITNVATYRPIARGIPLAASFSASFPTFFSYQRGAGDPIGGMAFFAFAVKSGALTADTLASDSLLAASLAPFTFAAAPPADEACPGAGCAP